MTTQITFLHQKSYVDPDAIKQLKYAAALPGMVTCVGMPDLHPGGKYPVGASFTSTVVHPELVGQDIGCGMTLYELDCAGSLTDRQVEKMYKVLRQAGIESASAAQPDVTVPQDMKKDVTRLVERHQNAFGTIGGGNHFAELQSVERLESEGVLDPARLHLLVHSGSRTLGEEVLRLYKEDVASKDSRRIGAALQRYLILHDAAVSWARQNREEIARKVSAACKVNFKRKILDICHNSVAATGSSGVYVHRKGAAPTDCGLVAIPGSRGSMTYIVQPTADADVQASAGWSVAHGAGRVIGRKDLQRKLEKRYPSREACDKALRFTNLGGRVVCNDDKMLRQEAPEAYKEIDDIVDDLTAHGLVNVCALMRPIITCKL
jgi:release factor H-coupled RctB family protein